MEPVLYMIFGLPGTGKSYLASSLAEATGYIHLNTDRIRDELNLRGKYDKASKEKVYRVLEEKAEENLSKGISVIVDGTFHRSSRREKIFSLALSCKARVCRILLTAEEQVIRERVSKDRPHSEADYEVYQKIRDSFEVPDQPYLLLMTDRISVDDMIQRVKEYCNDSQNYYES